MLLLFNHYCTIVRAPHHILSFCICVVLLPSTYTVLTTAVSNTADNDYCEIITTSRDVFNVNIAVKI